MTLFMNGAVLLSLNKATDVELFTKDFITVK